MVGNFLFTLAKSEQNVDYHLPSQHSEHLQFGKKKNVF